MSSRARGSPQQGFLAQRENGAADGAEHYIYMRAIACLYWLCVCVCVCVSCARRACLSRISAVYWLVISRV